MAKLPERASEGWKAREGPVVLATLDRKGVPNAIYATCASQPDAEHLLVADNYFAKTRANIESGSRGALLFMTKDGEAFQVKGPLRRYATGPYFEGMKKWLAPEMPGHAAVVLSIEEAYCGSERLL
jgi:predicted pyridoxine 5'-phosphate oxidase superfamily flavin-nucleotide-binding protein